MMIIFLIFTVMCAFLMLTADNRLFIEVIQ